MLRLNRKIDKGGRTFKDKQDHKKEKGRQMNCDIGSSKFGGEQTFLILVPLIHLGVHNFFD